MRNLLVFLVIFFIFFGLFGQSIFGQSVSQINFGDPDSAEQEIYLSPGRFLEATVPLGSGQYDIVSITLTGYGGEGTIIVYKIWSPGFRDYAFLFCCDSVIVDGGIFSVKGEINFPYFEYGKLCPGNSFVLELTVSSNVRLLATKKTNGLSATICGNECKYRLVVAFEYNNYDTSINYADADILDNFYLYQNYPNPFNPETNITYSIPKTSFVTVEVYNAVGQEIATLVESNQPAGNHQVIWNAADISSGVYFYVINAGDYSKTMKMILMK